MKKIVAIFLCLLTLFAVSCSRGQAESDTQAGLPADQPDYNEIASKMFDDVINDKICVIDEQLGEIKLKECRFPSTNARIDEIIIRGKAVLDLDGDGVNEYIIKAYSNDCIILHYNDGKVYSFAFEFESFNNLKIDGTFYWNGPNLCPEDPYVGIFDSGASRIEFDGAEIKLIDLYKIVYDENYNREYYIGEKSVTEDEYYEYLSSLNGIGLAEFTAFDAPWYAVISEKEAVEIASEYWGIKSGDIDEGTGFRYALFAMSSMGSSYTVALQWLVEEHHYSTVAVVTVDAFTGEIKAPK